MSKLSQYNFFINDNDKTICFNGISRFIFALNSEEFTFLQSSLNNLEEFERFYPSYFALLKAKSFITDDKVDELDIIRFLNRKDIYLDNFYRLTINPTLECNFNCWYCYETHPKGYVSEELKEKIIKHINNVASDNQIRGLDLSWFGGEPLLYFEKIVYPISLKAKSILEKNKLLFHNHATTNAYLIDKQMVKKFKEIDLTTFQITIDGVKEEHDKIRNEKGKPSFEKIMENINLICESNEKAHVLLRINYTDKTLESIDTIFDLIPQTIKKTQISIGFHRVWQTINNSNNKNAKNKLIAVIDEAINRGFLCSYPESIPEGHKRCYADKFWHAEINFDGNVYKCTMDYTKPPHGKILDNGNIEWDNSYISTMYANSTFENEMCLKCKLLPICFGPCSRKIVEEKINSSSCLKKLCYLKTSELGYEKIILDYYKYLLRQKVNP
jgi:uncharacterized protein